MTEESSKNEPPLVIPAKAGIQASGMLNVDFIKLHYV